LTSVNNIVKISLRSSLRVDHPIVSKAASPSNFGLDLEDYLIGLTSLPSELVRFL
jgi:hypothetical protein